MLVTGYGYPHAGYGGYGAGFPGAGFGYGGYGAYGPSLEEVKKIREAEEKAFKEAEEKAKELYEAEKKQYEEYCEAQKKAVEDAVTKEKEFYEKVRHEPVPLFILIPQRSLKLSPSRQTSAQLCFVPPRETACCRCLILNISLFSAPECCLNLFSAATAVATCLNPVASCFSPATAVASCFSAVVANLSVANLFSSSSVLPNTYTIRPLLFSVRICIIA